MTHSLSERESLGNCEICIHKTHKHINDTANLFIYILIIIIIFIHVVPLLSLNEQLFMIQWSQL